MITMLTFPAGLILTVLMVSTSCAAPACCDPSQASNAGGSFLTGQQVNSPMAPEIARMQAPPISYGQRVSGATGVAARPVQASRASRQIPVAPAAASSAGVPGCCAARGGYAQQQKVSGCCGGGAAYAPVQPQGCCAGGGYVNAPAAGCCQGRGGQVTGLSVSKGGPRPVQASYSGGFQQPAVSGFYGQPGYFPWGNSW